MNHSRAPGRRCSTSGVTEVAREAAMARTVAQYKGGRPKTFTLPERREIKLPDAALVRSGER
ncbi:hypothetical protein [Streptomyces chromofuscus]|uniref:hypothetical protein n=1 Tax=Streptomyces chromofuscus TaxID=42881 RepID=UPI00167716E2|nr:hypothetical protein [Streptomyces chromofuscus]